MQKFFYLTVCAFMVFASCQRNNPENSGDHSEKKSQLQVLDSVQKVVAQSLKVIENFPVEEVDQKLKVLEDHYLFFMKTDYVFPKKVYLNELDKLEFTRKAFVRSGKSLAPLHDEADLAYQQLERLKNAYKKNQVSDEDFEKYLKDEIRAVDAFLFNYYKKVERSIDGLETYDELVTSLEKLRAEASKNE
ncbi:MAG: hypothetical protein JJU02_07920 [Cryomorphaceae bacterium]|nr:hypothetical protein [Cryomorphaceae bacterium]